MKLKCIVETNVNEGEFSGLGKNKKEELSVEKLTDKKDSEYIRDAEKVIDKIDNIGKEKIDYQDILNEALNLFGGNIREE